MSETDELQLKGPARAAALILALGEEAGGKLMALLSDDELREVSRAMVALRSVPAATIEALCLEFAGRMGRTSGVSGSAELAERLLRKMIPPGRVDQILEDIHGPAGKNIWDKLGKVNESVLSDYLCHEHPQTAAMVLSRVTAEHAARVIALLPEPLAIEVIERMLTIEGLQREAVDDVERTLKVDFMVNLSSSIQRDPHEKLAEIFNSFDRTVESRMFSALENRNQEAASRIRSLMFTFEDLIRLAPRDIQTVLRAVDSDIMPLALKGASEKIRDLFMSNMTERAAKMLREDIEALGPVRLRDVDAAQLTIVSTAKELAAQGEIEIGTGKEDDLVI
ncbi:MAG: flagellar motor switch protein FliG [Acidiphilium sp. 37-67-22]|jgi:flagellar motor switch protein FliG|uniref:flagellar motor switch protein FliG n=1 Tax=unclassified Acidiphilium TaxID=2617493 RepID=UPI000BD6A67A|nr:MULTISPECIES: flagellar motor switch protein FliG [unclassified Acidiphilium]OYV87086.1 MAG: flagellar motor switch protein FliG [Acidiphilium sp. 21-68-69]OYW12513.1 MAG: flagellar motor switch protein FliG [Acidiphilium sp. 37-67-22]OYV56696.1 MAG: flagellar motor switch protein FliG [Acidiphilium sp. 20-67-58]HQT60859.1 flagellar motor switch protein FliG [Acidiphilium sp.]HQT72474.1 flagellar motor switch protein FliG [Acidiphilium sp.]